VAARNSNSTGDSSYQEAQFAKVTAVATRANERLSVIAKRRNIPQMDGGVSHPAIPILKLFLQRRYMNGRSQMQGGKNWI
jgi:hypothetical protein